MPLQHIENHQKDLTGSNIWVLISFSHFKHFYPHAQENILDYGPVIIQEVTLDLYVILNVLICELIKCEKCLVFSTPVSLV